MLDKRVVHCVYALTAVTDHSATVESVVNNLDCR